MQGDVIRSPLRANSNVNFINWGSRNILLHFTQKRSRFWERLRHFSTFEKMAPQAVPENGLLRPNLIAENLRRGDTFIAGAYDDGHAWRDERTISPCFYKKKFFFVDRMV
jgi:hypothetical protein